MAKRSPKSPTEITSIRHKKDTRVNIPTEELRDFVAEDEKAPKAMLYPRDPSLDRSLSGKGRTSRTRARSKWRSSPSTSRRSSIRRRSSRICATRRRSAIHSQVSARKRDVKDGKAEDATRQPEQIRAFRDTWKLGVHSYLAYLHDRLVARTRARRCWR